MDLISILQLTGSAIGLVTLFLGFREYRRQGKQKRFECYRAFQQEISSYAARNDLITLLEDDDPALANIPIQERSEILGSLEAISVALNSHLISEAAAYNFFGYYSILIQNSKNYWLDLDRDSRFWSEFYRFASRMLRFKRKLDSKNSPVLTM